MSEQVSKRWQSVSEALRWRGLLFSSLLAVRELCRPIMYWHAWHIFQTDLQRMPSPYAKEKVEVKVFTAKENLEHAITQISSMGQIPLAEVRPRFDRGDAAVVAYVHDEPAGFMWLTFTDGADLALGVTWILREGVALRYGSFVLPKWRGLGIHSALNRALNEYARDRGLTRTLASISAVNPQSLNLAKHARNPKIMTLIVVHIRGVNWTYTKAIDAPFSSRFNRAAKKYVWRKTDSISDEL
jgi:GNAT superfamily N-acetyltransferase